MHVNGVTKLKLYSYTGIGNYLGLSGGAGPPNVNLGSLNILETNRARKLRLKPQLDVVKYSLCVQKVFR